MSARVEPTRQFCTYFDHRYLLQGLVLADSLRRHCPRIRLWVLCLDAACYSALTTLAAPDIVPVQFSDFERGDDRLRAAKLNRSLIEYYFTCTPSWVLFLLRHEPSVDEITYLDADLFFFSSPEPLFAEIGNKSIAIIPHRFPPAMRHWLTCGIYNVGWLTFRRNAESLACLSWWRERCLDWCYDRIEANRFADQKYLDEWPERFAGVHVVQHKGANLAAWNLANYHVTGRGPKILIDDQPLIFFHFHHLKRRKAWLIETDFREHGVTLNCALKQHVLARYLRALDEKALSLAAVLGTFAPADAIRENLRSTASISFRQIARDVAARKSFLYVNGRLR
jgi:hypothetical protein